MPTPPFSPPGRLKLRPGTASSFLRPWVPRLARMVSGTYLRLIGYRGTTVRGQAQASGLWTDFYAGRLRLIVAFRHPYGNDPQVLASTVARHLRVPGHVPFVQFVHGVEVGWWAGPLARWILPRTGGLPVDHGKGGWAALDAIRHAIVAGKHPLALAPEGQVTYLPRVVQRVESGFARLGFLAAEELQNRNSPIPVVILPVSFYHHYPQGTPRRLERILAALERRVLGRPGQGQPWERTLALRNHLFRTAELWYAERRGEPASAEPWDDARLLPLLETALAAAEQILGLPSPGGEYFARLYRIRTTGWDRFYPEPGRWRGKTSLERSLAARSATEAWSAFRHMELADLAWYLGAERPDAAWDTARLADALENLSDLENRLAGGNISHRKVLFPRSVEVVFGAPLDLTARLPDWHRSKRETLASTVEDLIKEWNRG